MLQVTTSPLQPGWCEALYEAHAARLLLYGRALGLSHSESEDVLHEVFRELLALEHPPGNPPGYALRSMRNRARNYRRGLLRRVLRELESRRWFEEGGGESPGERAAMRALQLLPAGQREVLVLKFWHALTFEEIGRLLDLSPHTVAGRYRYGLQKIRRHLDQLPKENHGLLPLLEAPAPVG